MFRSIRDKKNPVSSSNKNEILRGFQSGGDVLLMEAVFGELLGKPAHRGLAYLLIGVHRPHSSNK